MARKSWNNRDKRNNTANQEEKVKRNATKEENKNSTSTNEVTGAMKKLKRRESSAHDKITSEMLKNLRYHGRNMLPMIFNVVSSTGECQRNGILV